MFISVNINVLPASREMSLLVSWDRAGKMPYFTGELFTMANFALHLIALHRTVMCCTLLHKLKELSHLLRQMKLALALKPLDYTALACTTGLLEVSGNSN